MSGPRPAIDTVVFDLGGVLVDWDPRRLYRRRFDDEAAMERFLREVCSPEWNARQDAGCPWDVAIAELSARRPLQALLIAADRARWVEMLGLTLPGSVELRSELRGAGLRLYALTHGPHETFPLARERYPFLAWFEGVAVSGEEKLIKPDPAIYARRLSRHAIAPARAVFVDDAPRDVEAAAGLHALRFCDAARLRAEPAP